jgi:hypothetical protein
MNRTMHQNQSRVGNSRAPNVMIDLLNSQLAQIQTTVTDLSTQITSLNTINDDLRARIIYLENVILTLTGIQ